MKLSIQPFTVHKRFALTISRGTTASTTNLWLKVEQDGLEGWGEASPFSVGETRQTTDDLLAIAEQLLPALEPFSAWERQRLTSWLEAHHVPSALLAAIDIALWDWLGKAVNLPLWKLWGLDTRWIVPTSVTIGIASPEAAQARLQDWVAATNARRFKVKLGSPEGIEADRRMFEALMQVAPASSSFLVDANGGWDLESAIEMSHWLAERGVDYLEQPLPQGQEQHLAALQQQSVLPIFIDESCWNSQDIVSLASAVDGINIKLLKCGGLTEAQRMIQVAQAFGLQVMFGCYSDSSLLNTAAAQLAPFANYLDLDSHLNLADDPFQGALLSPEGSLQLSDRPGLGVQHRSGL